MELTMDLCYESWLHDDDREFKLTYRCSPGKSTPAVIVHDGLCQPSATRREFLGIVRHEDTIQYLTRRPKKTDRKFINIARLRHDV